jgi:signal transduction histidine kinase
MPQMTRNLSIRSKLIPLLALPVAGTVLLGVPGVAAGWGDRASAAEQLRLAVLAGQAVAAVHELQEERVRTVAWVGGGGRAGQAELAARRRRVDRALAAWQAGAAGLAPAGGSAPGQAAGTAVVRLDRLVVVRAEVDRRLLGPGEAAAGFDALVAALLVVTRRLAERLDAPEPARSARLLLALASAKEATGRERTLLAAGQVPPVPLAAAAAVARAELNGVRAAAGGRLDGIDRALDAPAARAARRLELALLEPAPEARSPTLRGTTPAVPRTPPTPRTPPAGPVAGDPEAWRAGLAARAGALRRVERQVAADLARASAAWSARQERRARDRLALAAGVAIATLAAALLALMVLAGPGRRPPVPGAAVPGLARRGQALADRQLQLLEDLARDEPDPLRRQGLLGVDHLANRLRRTAETLLAMAGEPARQDARPLPVTALLHAAVAEAEPGGARQDGTRVGRTPGRRVELLTTGEAEVEGTAAADLVHLLAELLDNAAAFSPPTAPIVVTGAPDGDGHLIEVTDRGLGMTDQELSWANQRLAGGGHDQPAAAAGDRLGLQIAGRLAARNGFGVRLGRSPAGGVTAAVRLPAERLTTRAPAQVRPA